MAGTLSILGTLILETVGTAVEIIGRFLGLTWWLWLFVIVWPLFVSTWLYWRNERFKHSIKWKLFEIRIPREVHKSPRAMEQIITALHSLRNAPGDIKERWWDGEVTRWFSLEMVSFGGEIRLFIRLYFKQENLVKSAFYSYYPEVEMEEVNDYLNDLPAGYQELTRQGFDMWGTEMLLDREGMYPIKTYPEFESSEEEKEFDPISAFLEVLAKVKKEEIVGIQILIAPTSHSWRRRWDVILTKLREPETKSVSEEEGGGKLTIARTPGEIEILKAVENNLSKPAFDTLVRFIYLSPKALFYDSFARRGLTGAFRQYNALNLNSLRQNYKVSTRTKIWFWPFVFPKLRNRIRKQRLYLNYFKREVPPETFMGKLISSHPLDWNFASRRFLLNTEAIATLFHIPTAVVLTAPHIRRVESKKGGPPAGLAIFGGEEEIEKFK